MEFYVNLDNCRKEYPEAEFKLDVRGALYVSCPKKYNSREVIPHLLNMLELDNEGLKFPAAEGPDGTPDGGWRMRIIIGVEIEYFFKEDSVNAPVNGKTTRTFAALHFPGLFDGTIEIYKVNSDEEAHKMALEDKNCVGYDLFTKEYTNVDGKTIMGEPEVYKKVVFGKVCTLEEIMDMDEEQAMGVPAILMLFGQDKAVKTRDGKFVDWKEDVEYISE